MQAESEASKLLHAIADKLGRSRQEMQPFIAALENNWFTSREALGALTPTDFERMKIPARLGQLISEEVRQPEKMEVELPLDEHLVQLGRRLSQQSFTSIVGTLHRIFFNISENLMNEKYRTLKKSNPKISELTAHREVVETLKFGGFVEGGPGFVMHNMNLERIDQCLECLNGYLQREEKFNPYQSYTSSLGGTTAQTYRGGEDSSMNFKERLDGLVNERTKMMSTLIRERNVQLFQVEEEHMRGFEQMFNEEREGHEDERLYMERVKEQLKQFGQEQNFVNKRKAEYLDLLKQPCYRQTAIRVKLPNNWVWECTFSPLETLQTLVQLFHETLIDKNMDYYLYMTPPVQKLKGVILRKTFYDLGCVPRAYFYFKSEQPLTTNIFTIQPTRHRGD